MKIRKLKAIINKRQDATTPRRDKDCEICHGARGGVAGNNNIVDGIVMCDNCHARYDPEFHVRFNPNEKCSPLLTQCPRCNNPHNFCDQNLGVRIVSE